VPSPRGDEVQFRIVENGHGVVDAVERRGPATDLSLDVRDAAIQRAVVSADDVLGGAGGADVVERLIVDGAVARPRDGGQTTAGYRRIPDAGAGVDQLGPVAGRAQKVMPTQMLSTTSKHVTLSGPTSDALRSRSV
jgi:hypothetical protein